MSISRLLVIFCACLVAGCAQLPVGGPNRFAIDRGATESIHNEPHKVVTDYVLVDISAKVLENSRHVGPESFFRSFGTGRAGPPPEIKIGVGDTINMTIFESSGGGLFTGGATGTRPGGSVTLPAQAVDNKGFITVPYAGRIKASGRTLDQIQKSVEQELSRRAIEPQVILAVGEQNSAEASIFGDAVGNGRTRVRPAGERMLEIIARVGLRAPGHEVFVTLQRGGRRATVHFPAIFERPEENIFILPGDIVYINRLQQRFSIFGPTGSIGQTAGLTGGFTFDAPELSLTEAIAKAGGLLDTRANAGHVFLYRLELRDILEKNGVNLKGFPPERDLIPTIYRANFRDPSIFFSAGKFPMRHRDVIYVANADSVELEKFLGFIRLITSTAAGVTGDITATRDAIRALSN